MSKDKIYRHEYKCMGCKDLEDKPGCSVFFKTKDNSEWIPTDCQYGLKGHCDWSVVEIKEVKND